MPPVNPLLSSVSSASQQLLKCPGLAVSPGLTSWVINKFSFFVGFALPIMEKFGFIKWYKSTEEEKERLISRNGDHTLKEIVTWIETNIEYFRASFFIVYLIPSFFLTYDKTRPSKTAIVILLLIYSNGTTRQSIIIIK